MSNDVEIDPNATVREAIEALFRATLKRSPVENLIDDFAYVNDVADLDDSRWSDLSKAEQSSIASAVAQAMDDAGRVLQ